MVQKDINSIFILCLAGLGKRFTDEGIHCPKYLLPIDESQTTILEESLKNFNLKEETKIILCCNESHREYELLIQNILKLKNYNSEIIVTENTNGQAHTAYIASKFIVSKYPKYLEDLPIIFFNGDTILKNRNISKMISLMEDSLGLIDCFTSQNPKFSYIQTTNKKNVSNIEEKVCISDKATSGLYLFSTASIYMKEFEEGGFLDSGDETYISHVYKSMISKGKNINFYLEKDLNNTLVLGTPEQYLQHFEPNH